MEEASTLAYCDTATIVAVKFYSTGPSWDSSIKLYWSVIYGKLTS